MPNMSKQTEREIKEKMIWLTKKYNVSRFIFLLASILLIIMNAFTGVISAYAIAKNNNLHSVAIFIAIAFITTTLTFLSSLSTVFNFSVRTSSYLSAIKSLEEELQQIESDTPISDIKSLTKNIANIDIID